MRASLHNHSRFSDGTQWPEELVARASRLGIELLALSRSIRFRLGEYRRQEQEGDP